MTQTNSEREALIEFKDAVKQLCNDFSSLQGNVYIKDVAASLDALCERFIESPISQNEQQEAVAEIVCDPMFLPALKVPLVSWKADIVKFSIGTKLYTSPPKQAIPEGWKLVPIEPTKEMANAGFEISSTSPSVDEMRSIYKTMLNASPTNTEVGE